MSALATGAPRNETRDQIVNAAADLFWRNGYAATSLAAVAEAADCHGGSLYHFFKTKEQLAVAVLERYLERLESQIIRPAFARSGDPVERVFGVLGVYREMLDTTARRYGCPVGNLAVELADHSPAARAIADRCFDRLADAMAESLRAASDRLPTSVDPDDLARLVLTTIEGGILLARAKDDLEPFDAAVRQLRTYFRLLEQQVQERTTISPENE